MRSLEFRFPPYLPGTWPHIGHEVLIDWTNVANWAAARHWLNPRALTIRIRTCPAEPWYDLEGLFVTIEQGQNNLNAYVGIIAPLVALGAAGLANFHAGLEWPWTSNAHRMTESAHGHHDDYVDENES